MVHGTASAAAEATCSFATGAEGVAPPQPSRLDSPTDRATTTETHGLQEIRVDLSEAGLNSGVVDLIWILYYIL